MLRAGTRKPLSTIDIIRTSNYNPRSQSAQIGSPSSQACGGISRTRKQYFFSRLADTQMALGGFGTVRLNETTLPEHALFLGKFGQFESSDGDELAGTH